MSIRTRLTLIFTGLIAVILLVLDFYIYFSKLVYSEQEFYTRLKERAVITAEFFLKEDEYHFDLHQQVQKKYLQILPEEIILIYDQDNKSSFVEENAKYKFPTQLISQIRSKKELKYRDGNRQVFGLFYSDNQGNFVIIASAVDTYGLSTLNYLLRSLVLSFLGGVVLVFFAGQWFGKQALQPVLDIIQEVNQITASKLDLRVHQSSRKDEFNRLALTFNQVLERLENAFEMQKSFVNNASHELRTPLTTIIGEIEVALQKSRNEVEYQIALKSILSEAEKLKKLTNNLLILAQTELESTKLLMEPIRVDELVWEVYAEVCREFPHHPIKMEFADLPEDASHLLVLGNYQLLEIAIKNILENACKYCIEYEVKMNLQVLNQEILIEISDKGIGIDEPDLKKVFQPFFRADNARKFSGSGVGLFMVNKIIQLHQGNLELKSKLNEGTIVRLFLPIQSLAA